MYHVSVSINAYEEIGWSVCATVLGGMRMHVLVDACVCVCV